MATWSDVGNALKTAGKALPGGLQLLGGILTATGVGAAVGAPMEAVGAMLAHALGTEATPDAIHAAIASDPAAAQKALEIETNAKVQLQQMAVTQAMATMQNETTQQAQVFADIADARKRDTAIQTLEPTKGNVRANWMLIAAYASCITIVVLMLVFKVDGNTAVGGALILLLGGFSKDISQAFGFEYGSSRSSQTKDATIAAVATAE